MRRLVAFLLSGLPLSDAARRAVDETLLDWEFEAQTASTAAAVRQCVRSLCALARVLAGSTIRETGLPPLAWLTGCILLIGIAPSFAFVALDPMWNNVRHPLGYWAPDLVPTYVALLLPWAFFVAAAWPRRRGAMPAISLVFIGLAIAVPLVGWVQPEANQRYREGTYHALNGDDGIRLPRGATELTLPDLTVVAWGSPWTVAAWGSAAPGETRDTWFTRGAFIVMAPALALFASAVRRMGRCPRRLLLVSAPASTLFVICFLVKPGLPLLVLTTVWIAAAFLLQRRTESADLTLVSSAQSN